MTKGNEIYASNDNYIRRCGRCHEVYHIYIHLFDICISYMPIQKQKQQPPHSHIRTKNNHPIVIITETAAQHQSNSQIIHASLLIIIHTHTGKHALYTRINVHTHTHTHTMHADDGALSLTICENMLEEDQLLGPLEVRCEEAVLCVYVYVCVYFWIR